MKWVTVGVNGGTTKEFDGPDVGHNYKVLPSVEDLIEENKLLKAQLQAQTERSDFIEDCIAEMAMQVYSEV